MGPMLWLNPVFLLVWGHVWGRLVVFLLKVVFLRNPTSLELSSILLYGLPDSLGDA